MSVPASLNRALFPPRLLARHLRQKAGLKNRHAKLFFIAFTMRLSPAHRAIYVVALLTTIIGLIKSAMMRRR